MPPQASSLQATIPTSGTGGTPLPIQIRGVYGDGQPATTPDGSVVNVSMFPTVPGKFSLRDEGGAPVGNTVILNGNLWEGQIVLDIDAVKALKLGYAPGATVGLAIHLVAPSLGIGGNSTVCQVTGTWGGLPQMGHRVVVLVDPPAYAVPSGAALDVRLAPNQAHDLVVLDGGDVLLERVLSGNVPQ